MVSIESASGNGIATARLELPNGRGIQVRLEVDGDFSIDKTIRRSGGGWSIVESIKGALPTEPVVE